MTHRLITACFLALGLLAEPQLPSGAIRPALAPGRLGLYETRDFRIAVGNRREPKILPQILWYFQNETLALPLKEGAGFDPHLRAQQDVRQWMQHGRRGAWPPMVWIGSPERGEGLVMESGTALRTSQGQLLPYSLVPKIPLNLSYFDESSLEHLKGRSLRLRGRMREGKFEIRTLWPEDYDLPDARLELQPLAEAETLAGLVRKQSVEDSFMVRLLWKREGASLADKPVLAFMLNGAQGDDDEAHGGHFALATGRFGPKGQWDDWLINNFYNLANYSEKGITASILPMDAYMADLNSGQSWYRPSFMLVAVLRRDRVPSLYQEAMGRVFNHFYRQALLYHHATANCAGISMETLRSLGWRIPPKGPTGRIKGFVALPFLSLKERSLATGKQAFDYLWTEQSNLYPFAAFEAAGEDLLKRMVPGRSRTTPFEHQLSEDLEALLFVRIPQFPSSRALGQAPVASLDEYLDRVPKDRSQWKIVPVPPRPLPVELRPKPLPSHPWQPSTWGLWAYGVIGAVSFSGLGVLWRKRRRPLSSATPEGPSTKENMDHTES